MAVNWPLVVTGQHGGEQQDPATSQAASAMAEEPPIGVFPSCDMVRPRGTYDISVRTDSLSMVTLSSFIPNEYVLGAVLPHRATDIVLLYTCTGSQ